MLRALGLWSTVALCAGCFSSGSGSAADAGSASGSDAGDTDGCGVRTCVSVPPPWAGPVAIAEVGIDEALGGCQGAFGQEVWALSGALDPGEAQCLCECGPPTDVTCGSATLGAHSTQSFMNCMDPPFVEVEITQACEDFGTDFPQTNYSLVPAPPSGACASSAALETSAPSFGTQMRACALSEPEACAGGVCADAVPPGFDASLCIYVAGSRACPVDGPFSQLRQFHGDFSDERTCTGSCGCALVDASCSMDVEFVADCGANGLLIQSTMCSPPLQAPASIVRRGTVNVTGTPACAPNPDSVAASGTVAPTGTVTFCCAP